MSWMQYGRVPYEIGSHTAPGVRPKDIAHSLARVNRYTGHTLGVLSVARHSVFVSKLLDCNTWDAMYGLVHDVHETVVNDVSQPVKASMSNAWKEEWRRICDAADIALYGVLSVPYPMPPETAKLVKKADWIAAANEKRDLMYDCPREWSMLEEPPAHHLFAEPTSDPDEDAKLWLDRYVELAEAIGIRL